jgi:hypothetical protein
VLAIKKAHRKVRLFCFPFIKMPLMLRQFSSGNLRKNFHRLFRWHSLCKKALRHHVKILTVLAIELLAGNAQGLPEVC